MEKYILDDKKIKWYDLIGTFWWELAIKSFSYKGVSLLGDTTSCIIDSGTSFLAVPPTTYTTIQNIIELENTGKVDCSTGTCVFNSPCQN